MISGVDAAYLNQEQGWLGASLDSIMVFGGSADWTDWQTSIQSARAAFGSTGKDVLWSVPLIADGATLAAAASGAYDGNSTNEDLLDFYAQLPNGDRQFVILPHTAHSIGYSNNRHLLWYAMRNFLQAPAAVGA